MIIFGVDNKEQTKEQNRIILDLIYTSLKEETKKSRVDLYLNRETEKYMKKCISIANIPLGLDIAKKQKQKVVLIKDANKVWNLIDIKTNSTIKSYTGFKQVSKAQIKERNPEFFLVYKEKIYVPKAVKPAIVA